MTDHEIKEKLSEYLYSIQDAAIQAVVRHIVFAEGRDWQEIYKVMCHHMPELLKGSQS